MTEEQLNKIIAIQREETAIRERRFAIMKELQVMSWEEAQAKALSYLEEKRHAHAG